jgi:hypothetical protein
LELELELEDDDIEEDLELVGDILEFQVYKMELVKCSFDFELWIENNGGKRGLKNSGGAQVYLPNTCGTISI